MFLVQIWASKHWKVDRKPCSVARKQGSGKPGKNIHRDALWIHLAAILQLGGSSLWKMGIEKRVYKA